MSRARDIVLVVDDSPATLGVLNQALEEAGYTVLVAQDGAAALTLVGRVTPGHCADGRCDARPGRV